MSRLIMFSDFLSHHQKSHILESMEYIATRDGVELNENVANARTQYDTKVLPEASVAQETSKGQVKLIRDLIKEHPDLVDLAEYENYARNENMYTASVFITESFRCLEEMTFSNEDYVKYISERPGVEMNEQSHHGLFDQLGDADFGEVYQELAEHQGVVWRDIVSLVRMDAVEVDFDYQEAWKMLLQENMHVKAKELGIPKENFRWCASFHDESYHPHVHVMCWDKTATAGFQTKDNISNFKSCLANKVFANELWLDKELKYEARQSLEDTYRKKIEEQIRDISKDFDESTKPGTLKAPLQRIADMLSEYGSRAYAYQQPNVKMLVDKMVSNVLQQPELRPLLVEYAKSQERLHAFYHKDNSGVQEDFIKRLIHPEQKDRKVFHNTVLNAAYEIKQATRNHQLQVGSQFRSLNLKLHEQYRPKILNSAVDQERLATAVIKLGMMQEKDSEQIMREVEPILREEDRVIELYLDVKEAPELKTAELRLINKAYSENLLPKLPYAAEIYQANMAHSSAKMLQGFLTIMGTSAMENEQEARRMNAVRRRDEMMMKRANRKQ